MTIGRLPLSIAGQTIKADTNQETGRSWSLFDVTKTNRGGLIAQDTTYVSMRVVGDKTDSSALYGSSGVDVEREYLKFKRVALKPEAMNLGDIAYVRLTVRNMTQRTLNDWPWSIGIPAGWEIENASLGRTQDLRSNTPLRVEHGIHPSKTIDLWCMEMCLKCHLNSWSMPLEQSVQVASAAHL